MQGLTAVGLGTGLSHPSVHPSSSLPPLGVWGRGVIAGRETLVKNKNRKKGRREGGRRK